MKGGGRGRRIGFVKVSILLPVYNEGESVGEAVRRLKSLNLPAELIVIDDGSDEETAKMLDSLEGIRLVRNEENEGYGSAIKRGLEVAEGEQILIVDADGTYPYEKAGELLAGLDEYDMVVGARARSSIPLLRRPAKAVLGALASYLCGKRIPDLNSGFRAFRREVVERFEPILPPGFSFTATLTIAMLSEGMRVRFLPVEYTKREGRSKIRPLRDTLNFFSLIVRTIMYFNPLKVFLPISGFLMVGGGGLALYEAIFWKNVTDVALLVSLTGIQVGVLGLLADLIQKRTRL